MLTSSFSRIVTLVSFLNLGSNRLQTTVDERQGGPDRSDAAARQELGAPFLSSLVTNRGVSASTQNQSLAALLFLYQRVLGRALAWMDQSVRASGPSGCPWSSPAARCAACSSEWTARWV
jgi:hypothetical protein